MEKILPFLSKVVFKLNDKQYLVNANKLSNMITQKKNLFILIISLYG